MIHWYYGSTIPIPFKHMNRTVISKESSIKHMNRTVISKENLEPFTMTTRSPLLQALSDHHVHTSVVDMDHYRKLGRVKTDYIISVQPDEMAQDTFESFK